MKILIAASEAVPFAKTGGLGDVIGALPEALASFGHEVKVFLPFYKSIKNGHFSLKSTTVEGTVPINGNDFNYKLEKLNGKRNQIEYFFVRNDSFFDRQELYRDSVTGSDYEDNSDRFIFFARSILESVKDLNWQPDIIHVHDWQAGLVPPLLKTDYANDMFYKKSKTVLTIHNLAYQGMFDNNAFLKLGLSEKLFYPTSPFEFYGKINFLKAAISYADKITTVSPNYANEIQTEQYGCGLDGVLKSRVDDLYGILNGVDYKIWSPSRDNKIPWKFRIANLSGKKMNKIELLGKAGLPYRERTPLIGVVSRLADQKGFDLIAEISNNIFQLDLQMIILGTGEEKYHQLFTALEKRYPDKVKVYLTFDDRLAHFIEAGSDMFLMPSNFEPCGLNQLYSLKYGTIPIVRKVGGLADTVEDLSEDMSQGTGFVFEDYKSSELLKTINRSVKCYKKERLWIKVMKRAMEQDFSWQSAAREYLSLYTNLINTKSVGNVS